MRVITTRLLQRNGEDTGNIVREIEVDELIEQVRGDLDQTRLLQAQFKHAI